MMNKRRSKKRKFRQLFRNCTSAQKPVYISVELNLNKKAYVFLTCIRFKKNQFEYFWTTLCNYYCFSTATVVSRTRSNVTLQYIACLFVLLLLLLLLHSSVVSIIIILGISFMQGIYTYIPETDHVPREHCVATILM
jgi:hypothetical protein